MSMNDLPTQGLLQQLNSQKVSGEHLELLGKRAAANWSEGRSASLNQAVVETVKEAGLSPEQVKRVVEFANTAAYLGEFNKEGSLHRVVDFGSGGPANPGVVLQDLNDGGGGSRFDPGTGDYSAPPTTTKESSAWSETAFQQMFGSESYGYPEENPLGEVVRLREKLASEYETATATLSELEGAYADLTSRLFSSVKQAAMSGHSLSEVVAIWDNIAPSGEHVKVAFSAIIDPLVDNGVFRSHEQLAASLEKHASVGVVNPEHPLVVDFSDFCQVLDKLAEVREVQEEVGEGAARLTAFLKEAKDEGALVRAADTWKGLSNAAGRGVASAGEFALGKGSGVAKGLGGATRIGLNYVAPALAAHEVYRRTLKHNPTFNKARNTVVGAIPGTDVYRQKEYELQMRNQDPMYGDYGSYGGFQ